MASGWESLFEDAADTGWATLFPKVDSDDIGAEFSKPGPDPALQQESNVGEVPSLEITNHIMTELTAPASPWLQLPLASMIDAVLTGVHPTTAEQEEETQEDLSQINRFYFHDQPKLHTTKASASMLAGVEPHKLEPLLGLLVNALLHVNRHGRARLEAMMANSGVELILFAELCRYDETPMRVTHQHRVQTAPDVSLGTAAAESSLSGQPIPEAEVGHSSGLSMKAASIAKMFSTQQQFAMLLKCKVDESLDKEELIALSGSTLSWNQLLGSGTSACMLTALLETSAVSETTAAFGVRVRMVTTDKAPANLVTERMLTQSRQGSMPSIHLHCHVHKAATTLSKGITLLEGEVSGLINFALTLSVGAAMVHFRKALLQLVSERLVLIRGAPPAQAVAYRERMLQLFGSSGSRSSEKQHLLRTYANGDWRNSHQVEHYIPPGLVCDEAEVRQRVTEAIVFALSHRTFATFPRHRWLGAEVATDQVGLAVALHNLGALAFPRMATVADLERPNDPPLAAGAVASDPAGGEAEADMSDRQPLPAVPGLPAPALAAPEERAGSWSQQQATTDINQAEENAKRTRIVLKWLATRPFPKLCILRQYLQPMIGILQHYISRSGDTWQTELNVQTLSEAQVGVDHRAGAILDLVQQIAETKLIQQIRASTNAESWQWFPKEALNLQHQALAFRVSSKLGCLATLYLVAPTKTYPLRLFQLLIDPRYVDEVQAQSPCVFDDFTRSFLEKYPGPSLTSPAALGSLRFMSMISSIETVGLEWAHGRVHRLITSQQVQTHVPGMPFINAQFVCQQFCKGDSLIRKPGHNLLRQRRRVHAGEMARPKAKAKQHRGSGGAWRAFVSMSTRGQRGRVNFQQLGLAYRAAQAEDAGALQEARRVGAAATARARTTRAAAFGPPLRQLKRRRITARLAESAPQQDIGPAATTTTIQAQASTDLAFLRYAPLGEQLKGVRAVAKRASMAKSATRGPRQPLP